MEDAKKKRLKRVIIGIVILVIAGLIYAAIISATGFIIKCQFREVSGWLCPGCGVTHMCLAFLRGDIYEAFISNRVLFVLIPVIAALVVAALTEYVRGEKLSGRKKRAFDVSCALVIVILLVWTMIRNLIGV